ncbi:resolvase [Hymenobacter qilianensis]|uniref:Resolvase n=2 Tax=Hymenobacter qilianensis TaxID=1385715 RepID=A0ACB5PPE9_9BACT|nr:recombinase family protein [Hymenobacter qilianensis]QNP53208.1 recombinase family protein [Hymenobacter qilianensis]GGF58686.1 resolvase [Hymenobacter qilianensis]
MTAAIYARVSTKDKGQTNENQLRELRAFAERLGFTLYKEYCDQESGGTANRPQFQQLFVDAHQRRFDVVLFWSLDRFSREGVTETLNHLQRLTTAGVQFKSFTEPFLDSTGPFREAIIGFIAAIAKQERVRLGERVRAGLARSTKKSGRPSLPADLVASIQLELDAGLGQRATARKLGVAPAVVNRLAQANGKRVVSAQSN